MILDKFEQYLLWSVRNVYCGQWAISTVGISSDVYWKQERRERSPASLRLDEFVFLVGVPSPILAAMRGVAINGDVEDIYFAAVEIFAPAVRPLLLFGHYGRSLHANLSKFLPQFLIFFIHLLHDLQQILDFEARLRRTRDCGIGLIVRKLFLEFQDIVVLL